LRRHARLRRFAGEVDLDERRDRELSRGGLRGERVAELADLAHERRLPALEMADEVPPEGVAVDVVLRPQALGAVLAHHPDPRGAERSLGARPEVEAALVDDIVTEALTEWRRDLLPHVVAARTDARPNCGGELAIPEGARSRLDDACEQAAPADMEDGDCRL